MKTVEGIFGERSLQGQSLGSEFLPAVVVRSERQPRKQVSLTSSRN